MKIGLISDVHATVAPLQEALDLFQDHGVETILCAGDTAGYGSELEQTVQTLLKSKCRVVMGNHDQWWFEKTDRDPISPVAEYLRNLAAVMELKVAGKKIYMVHASPPDSCMEGIKLLDDTADLMQSQKIFWSKYLQEFPCDVLVVGHTHQVFAEKLGSVLVVNPGSTLFNHTCAILTLPEMTVQVLPLGGKTPVLSWNWGMEAVLRGQGFN